MSTTNPRTLTDLCGVSPAEFEAHLQRPAPDDGGQSYTVEESNALYEEGKLPGLDVSSRPLPMHLRPGAPQRRVVCAANRIALPSPDRFRFTHHLVLAPRHFHLVMHAQINACIAAGIGTRKDWTLSEQGFIDQWGTFMDRREAFQVAKAAGQLLYGPHLPGGKLDSSDLY